MDLRDQYPLAICLLWFDPLTSRWAFLCSQLFCTFDSLEEKFTTMADLRHRVLPPQLLLKWPKEASFCLWLLHPQPDTRPKIRSVISPS